MTQDQPLSLDPAGRRVAVVGATGAVGREMMDCLARRDFPVAELRVMASARSAGSSLETPWGLRTVEDLAAASFADVDIALFSAGGSTSLEHAERVAADGALVIDNSSAWRMDERFPLVVPEVNPHAIADARIIANPNCSTIQLVLPLKALDALGGLEWARIATYQSSSGAGQKGIDELLAGTRSFLADEPVEAKVHAAALPFNCVPRIGSFAEGGYTTEELKMLHETRKILELPALRVSATCVRVPTLRCHCEVVHAATRDRIDLAAFRAALAEMPNVKVVDDPATDAFPTVLDGTGSFDTFVGRIRRDPVDENGVVFWVVSDNLLKGAALNAVQIAEAIPAS